jgi:hypothetical protein
MHRVAILEYFSCGTCLLFVSRRGWEAPILQGLIWQDGKPLKASDLELCAERLMIDFHGLPQHWAASPRAEQYRAALALPPRVSALKRAQPLLETNLAHPAFSYRMDYWERLSEVLLPSSVRRLIEDVELLCIVPDGPLHTLPFAALRWDANTFLGERFGLCHAPGTAVLRHCQKRKPCSERVWVPPAKCSHCCRRSGGRSRSRSIRGGRGTFVRGAR